MKRILVFVAVAILVGLLYHKLYPVNKAEEQVQRPQIQSENLEGHKISTSPSGNKEIICTSNNQLVLMTRDDSKVFLKDIYENFAPLSTDPYSIYNLEDYLIQWSENEKYIFIKDSIYDIDKDNLICIKDNIIFSWVGNKGFHVPDDVGLPPCIIIPDLFAISA
ncbi:hypothetical protein [Anaerophilus nitritogenes]|uniref:hypothetical protein n=1 Tax=Anaerophilus nitritogenes TaxID=2498136 RepID=UPI00101DCEC4|nr:hypothetical protein [Anaerophilus nitritogenes]